MLVEHGLSDRALLCRTSEQSVAVIDPIDRINASGREIG